MSLNPITKTAGDIATYVKRQFGDESAVQVTDQDIYRWIDAAQLQIVSKVAPVKKRATSNIVKNQASYDLSTLAIHQIESIHYRGNYLPNRNFAEAERLIYDADPTTVDSGNPGFWYEWAGQVYLYPIPDTDYTNGFEVFYTGMPTPVTSPGDLLSLPDKYFEAIAAWVLSKAYELDEEFDQSQNQRQVFNDVLNDQNQEERTSANMTYPVITYVED